MRLRILSLCFFTLASGFLYGQPSGDELRYALVLTRHGVRSPTWATERLNEYSAAPWPEWKAAPGELTPHGRTLMKIMGGYYREYFASMGLLKSNGCAAADRTYLWADTDQRTTETAKAIAEGFSPTCGLTVHGVEQGSEDSLFDPIATGEVHPDPEMARAAILGRVGSRLETLLEVNRPAFDVLDQVLDASTAKTRLADQPLALTKGKGAIAMTGALSTASTLTENLLLEYCEGMSGAQLGWGRLDAAKLRQVMALHTSYAELLRRTPYLASTRGSNLLSHIVRSMEQAKEGKATQGALGPANNALTIISGHDTNISNLSGILRLSWLLPGYQPDDVPPGGALLFLLWRSRTTGVYSVRLRFIAQSLEQMHNPVPLSLARPPLAADLFIPGCSTPDARYPCDWESFKRLVTDSSVPLTRTSHPQRQ